MKTIFNLFILAIIIIGCQPQNTKHNDDETPEIIIDSSEVSPPAALIYGLDSSLYHVKHTKVRSNSTLASLLYDGNNTRDQVNELIHLSEKIYDSRKIKLGNHCAYLTPKSDTTLSKYFVYEISKLEYLRFGTGDTTYVDLIKKDVDTLNRYAAFSIQNSLWMSIKENNLNPMLAIELSEIYAWTIDFFGLQKGDSVRVVYDELMVDGESIGIDKIKASYFRHVDQDYYAIAFNQDGKDGYFDLEGNSLRKAFLKAPLRFSRISSKFSHSRLHPILKIRRPHHGIDYAAPIGTPVQTIGDGRVISITNTKGAGRMVKIKHNSIYTTAYMHLHRFGKGVKKGTSVKQGQIIGYVGSSGLSTGPHLDFRVYKHGTPVDPLKVKSPPVEPINTANLSSFKEQIFISLNLLNINQTYLAVYGEKADEIMF